MAPFLDGYRVRNLKKFMLTELVIQNFAIIDRLQVALGKGFNVLTGETGAGKSIIIDAVGLLLGDRARPELIRTGEAEAVVEGLFDLNGNDAVKGQLSAAGFGVDDELLVKRVIASSGKNRVYLNGSIAKLGQLQQVIESLVNIYGQHEHQSLQKTDSHLVYLDRFAGLEQEIIDYRELHRELSRLQDRHRKLAEAEKDRTQRLDYLKFQVREIDAANLTAGEDEALEKERRLLMAGERLSSAVSGGYEDLYAGDEAICDRLERVSVALAGVEEYDTRLAELNKVLHDARLSLEDAALQLRDFTRSIEFESGRQEEVEARLAQLAELKRKFAPTVTGILEFREALAKELDDLEHAVGAKSELATSINKRLAQLRTLGSSISKARREAAAALVKAVRIELAELALPHAEIEVRFFPLSEIGPNGLERVEFYLSPNPGEELRPLAWIASGGELSRIMLALRRVAPRADTVGTLIFYEVDAGIGGQAATAVGERLRAVARGAQVVCVTHLPQVAAFADTHFRVEKMVEQGRTFTALVPLKGETRIQEMARMLGGAKVSDQTLAHARDLLNASTMGAT